MVRSRGGLVEEVTDELRSLVLSGEFKPGELLPPQRSLAERFGVGASTIREAVGSLTAVGLLQSRPGIGTWVRHDATSGAFHPQAVRSRLGAVDTATLYEARAVIEVALTEFAAERAAPEEKLRIRRALSWMVETQNDTAQFVRADIEFHTAVADAGHNDLLAQFYRLSRALLEQATHELVSLPSVKEESIEIQDAILQAVEAGNTSAARQAAQAHMQYIYRLLHMTPAKGNMSGEETTPAATVSAGG